MTDAARTESIAQAATIVPTAMYSIQEAAKGLGISRATLWRLIGDGRIPVVWVTPGKSGTRRITGQALLDYIQAVTRRVA